MVKAYAYANSRKFSSSQLGQGFMIDTGEKVIAVEAKQTGGDSYDFEMKFDQLYKNDEAENTMREFL